MKTAASIGFLLVAASVMLAILLPLGIFFVEFLENPGIFSIETTSHTSAGMVQLDISVTYEGSVPLKDFQYVIVFAAKNYTVSLGDLVKGKTVSARLDIPFEVYGKGPEGYNVYFKIMGLYGFSLGVRHGSS